ncbi:MAG TPA: ABC transporter permease subunit [Bacteroidota bacterium]
MIRNELLKTFFKWRSYIGFIAIAIVVPLVEVGFRLEGGTIVSAFSRGLSQAPFLPENVFNGYFVTHFIMNSLWVHIPFLITLVAGDMLAGEAASGTFRILLTRPPSRTRVFFTKYAVTLLYTALLVLFLALLTLGLGLWLFGSGDLVVPAEGFAVIPAADAPARMALAFAFAIWSMWCVAALALFFSSFVENAIGPIIGSMAVIIVFLVISSIPLSLFAAVRPFLFTTYMSLWRQAMAQPIQWADTVRAALAMGGFTAAFTAAAWLVFVRKDVLS